MALLTSYCRYQCEGNISTNDDTTTDINTDDNHQTEQTAGASICIYENYNRDCKEHMTCFYIYDKYV